MEIIQLSSHLKEHHQPMSIMRDIPTELNDLITEANLIVEVKGLEAFSEDVAIKNSDALKTIPPFKKTGFSFQVKSVLKNTAGIVVPDIIRVPAENWRRSLSQHKERYADGPSKSYNIKKYDTEVSSVKKADILFLHHFQGTFELVVKDSYESKEALEKVTMLIAAL
jgi:hypothetical protein